MTNPTALVRRLLSESNTLSAPRALARALLVVLLLLVLALYLPRYAWAFIGDDYVQFGYIRELVEVPATFYRAFDPAWSTWYYRPLQNLWLLALRLGFDLTPFPYYYLQGLWHLLAVALFYALARRLGLGRPFALAATALFALHAHHQDVVGWVSSVATPMVAVFSFAAVVVFVGDWRLGQPEVAYGDWGVEIRDWRLEIRQNRGCLGRLGQEQVGDSRRSNLWLPLAVLALLSHESGILLPPFLLLVAVACPRPRPVREYMLLGGLLLAAVAVGAVHLLRPNLTLAVSETPLAAYLDAGEMASFLAVVLGRWTMLTRGEWGTALLNGLLGSPAGLLLPAGFLLLLGWLGYRFGRMATHSVAHAVSLRSGQADSMSYPLLLAWSALHLLFFYGALWVQAPRLLGGRHLYAAWAGVALLLALGARDGLERLQWSRRRHDRGRRMPASRTAALARYLAVFLGGLLAAYLAAQLYYARAAEDAWLAHAQEVAAVEAQMKELLPSVSAETAVYAREFVITPAFAPYAAAVWYGETGLEGGSLARLRDAGTLGPATHLFDYADGSLRELLPAVHDYAASLFLWPDEAAPVVAGPDGAPRLALPTGEPITLTTTVPAGSGFYTAFHGPPGTRYRARAVSEGRERVLAAGTVPAGPAGWQAVARSLPGYWGRETTFLLEADAGAWAIPRLVQGDPE